MSRIQREVDANDDIDTFDRYEEDLMAGIDAELSLSGDAGLAWKQIGTGFRKWILRYVADCGGQKTYQLHTTRLDKIHGHIQTAFERITRGCKMSDDCDLN